MFVLASVDHATGLVTAGVSHSGTHDPSQRKEFPLGAGKVVGGSGPGRALQGASSQCGFVGENESIGVPSATC